MIHIGRSVSSCMVVWQQLQANAHARYTAPVHPMVAFEQPFPQSASKLKNQRPTSGENVSSTVDRMIQPQQPFNFLPVNVSNDPAADQGATASALGGPLKKKRGRPSKAEYEAKVAEAAARGEEYQPPPKRKKTPRPSQQAVPNPGIITPEVGASAEFSTGKESARKPKATPEKTSSLASTPTARNLALGVTTPAADQMQIDRGEQFKSTIPERQTSEFEGRGSLFSGMREHADYSAPQSSLTLQHDSTPQSDLTFYQGPRRNPATTRDQ